MNAYLGVIYPEEDNNKEDKKSVGLGVYGIWIGDVQSENENIQNAIDLVNILDRMNVPAGISFGEDFDSSSEIYNNKSLRLLTKEIEKLNSNKVLEDE